MSIGGRSKVKFMCSFGGKILPRPSDGLLKYVGGETRVIAVSPDITFVELTKKLTEITENDVVLKYQITPEDLDALVSVKSDEDLKHMMDEYNRHHHHNETPKLRTFLFPANPTVVRLGSPIEPQTIEQRYIEAINGIVRGAPIKTRPSFTLSASSSPKSESSPDGFGNEQHPEIGSYQLSRLYPMHRVRSSPNISQAHNYHHHHHHHSAYFQPPNNYLNCRLRPPPPPPLDFPRGGAGWDQQGGGNGKYGCSEERRVWGRANSVPHSPRNHGFRL